MLIAVDDSEITIGGHPHTILAAIVVKDADFVESTLQQLKKQFGLAPTDEIKWNGCNVEPRHRDELSSELLALLHKATSLVTISQTLDRQCAAEHLAIQIADYFDADPCADSANLDVVFDQGIIGDPGAYSDFLKCSRRPVLGRMTFCSVRSHDSGLVQLADILAGFNRLTTDISLGRSNKQVHVLDDGLGQDIDIDLLSYICLSLRWNTWGRVPPAPNRDDLHFDSNWPFKHVGGYGLRLHSSVVSDEEKEAMYSARVVYMGCLH